MIGKHFEPGWDLLQKDRRNKAKKQLEYRMRIFSTRRLISQEQLSEEQDVRALGEQCDIPYSYVSC